MTNDELELKLARLANNLVHDLDEVDAITFERGAAKQQKVQRTREAFGEAYPYLDQLRPPRPSPRPARHVPVAFDPAEVQFCRCGEYETCTVCLEAHRRFQTKLGERDDLAGVYVPDSLTDHGG